MIIGIDVREGIKKSRAGKGEYVYQVVSELIKAGQHQFVLFSDQPIPLEWERVNVKTKIWLMHPIWWQILAWLYLEFVHPIDVYFSPTSLIVPALVRGVPVVTAVMDFVSFLFPVTHNAKSVLLEKMWMRPALACSRRIIAISEATKRDAIKLFKVNPHKIVVTLLAASFSQQNEPYSLPAGLIILFVGTLEPRKNISLLVEAFNQVRQEVPLAKLVIVGRWGWQSAGLKQTIAQSPYKKDIYILTNIVPEQKKSIYQQAKVLAFPSLYEGFGLPPLEAMSLGVPVVSSNVASLPEVVGDAGILIPPTSKEELSQALKQILTDTSLAEELGRKGQIRAKQFSWEKTAQATLKVLEEVGKQ
ncbi:glycosyltransferase family 4 protein [Patescibacteria group bacterium]|nr:glycosyltransferase family 4 protein [Patescibacteria group bacterium]